MMPPRPSWPPSRLDALLVLAFAVNLAACGSDDAGNTSGSTDGGAAGRSVGTGGDGTGGGTGGSGGTGVGPSGGATGGGGASTPAEPPAGCTDTDTDPSTDKTCTSDQDCCGSGRVCGEARAFPSMAFYCAAPNEGGGAQGAPCTDSSECLSGVCFSSASSCTSLCDEDADCGPGDVCAEMTFNGVSMGACVRSCTHDGDCDGGQICTILSNTRAARNDLLCLDAFGDGPPGTDCTAVSACTHALCSSTADGNWCTNACETDAECPAALPTCEVIDFPAPGGGTTPVGLCFP